MGRDSRIGECLWAEWSGYGYEPAKDQAIVFYTIGHVDVEHDIVKRALASALQRDGSVVSLGSGYAAIENAGIEIGYAGEVDGSLDLVVCDESGETREGDLVDEIQLVTWVEIQ